jgi:spore germination protein YaaH
LWPVITERLLYLNYCMPFEKIANGVPVFEQRWMLHPNVVCYESQAHNAIMFCFLTGLVIWSI